MNITNSGNETKLYSRRQTFNEISNSGNETKNLYTRRQSFNETSMSGIMGKVNRNTIAKNMSNIFPRESEHISPSKRYAYFDSKEEVQTIDTTNTYHTQRTKLSSLNYNINRKSKKGLAVINFTKLPSLGLINITPKKEIVGFK